MINARDHEFLDLVDGDWVAICRNEYELLTGIILDARTPLERLRHVLIMLKKVKLLDYRELRKLSRKEVEETFRLYGYPWARQKSFYFQQEIPFDLLHASYEQIDSIKGIGPKLASLWMRILNPKDADRYVVIDTHVRRYLRNKYGIDDLKMSYDELSQLVRKSAAEANMSVSDWDAMIVEAGIRKRLARRKMELV